MAVNDIVSLALLVGFFPTLSMITMSLALYHMNVPPLVEACLQNFAGGLILAAVAAELFPLILEENKSDVWAGVTAGFLFAFFFINSFEALIEASAELRTLSFRDLLENLGGHSAIFDRLIGRKVKKACCGGDCSCHSCGGHPHGPSSEDRKAAVVNPMAPDAVDPEANTGQDLGPNGGGHRYTGVEKMEEEAFVSPMHRENGESAVENGHLRETPPKAPPPPRTSPEAGSPKIFSKKSKVVCDDCTNIAEASSHGSDVAVLEDGALEIALEAISDPLHKSHIRSHLQEMSEAIQVMEIKSRRFIEEQLTSAESEQLAEEVDETIHHLQYKIDHCRRLLQGSEAQNGEISDAFVSKWLTEEKKIMMNDRLKLLRHTAVHLIEHLKEENIDQETIHEMHVHMKEMDRHINHFHDAMDTWTSKWRSIPLPNVELGATLPVSLIVPVTLDCFVDGFLIGVAVALSPKAGYVLSAANCLEMGSLGMAYSARLSKCTGSTYLNRQLALYSPPIIMLLSSGFGALLAHASQAVPSVFIAFVAFGVYALLALVCGELIIEAKEAHADDEKWWISVCLFAGVFLVLMLHPVL